MPPQKYSPVKSPLISPEDRAQLVNTIAEDNNLMVERYRNAENWSEISVHLGLISLISALEYPWARVRHQAHTKKIIGHEYLALPKPQHRTASKERFLKRVREVAGAEITETRSFKGEEDRMPNAYKIALEDHDELKARMITDPLILALRKSVQDIQQSRK